MQKETTYYVKRDGIEAWLGRGVKPLKTDVVIEERVILCAEEGKVIKKGDFMCECIWLKADDTESDWEEIEPPLEAEHEDTEDVEGTDNEW